MAVSIEDIKKLRTMTGAGMMDCKNALAETNGDIQAAIEIIRKKGQAVAAKREDRQAAEGCVLAGTVDGFAAIVALKCETDFVAKNESFRALTKKILDAALAAKAKSLDEVLNLNIDGRTIAENITDEIGKTGEKMELGAYEYIEAPSVAAYEHLGNKLATLVGLNLPGISQEVGKEVAMQVAAMNPVAVNRDSVPTSIIEEEKAVAIEKTKSEQVKKAAEAALRKAGLNPNHFDSEDHIASNITKGWITEEEAEKGKAIMQEAAEKKAASMPQAMIDNIVNGRINKYYKENVLLEQEYHRDAKITVGEYLSQTQKGLVVVEFKRVNLNAD
ncbi:MAG: translation elongation factor Ts [Clostridium sp.]|nr:translation elongation factor Ts [Prevotella sp.]MCM1429735.1 translation elongation factor Ts [Clostridium sp.]MCM1476208.1 translation elongation factor Ts [Muribaculaceae bacterium]